MPARRRAALALAAPSRAANAPAIATTTDVPSRTGSKLLIWSVTTDVSNQSSPHRCLAQIACTVPGCTHELNHKATKSPFLRSTEGRAVVGSKDCNSRAPNAEHPRLTKLAEPGSRCATVTAGPCLVLGPSARMSRRRPRALFHRNASPGGHPPCGSSLTPGASNGQKFRRRAPSIAWMVSQPQRWPRSRKYDCGERVVQPSLAQLDFRAPGSPIRGNGRYPSQQL